MSTTAIKPKTSSVDLMRPTLQSGDVVLFSGHDFVSRLIRRVTRSRWSHIGLVITVLESDETLLLESTMLADDGRSGVAVRTLDARVQSYQGTVALRRVNSVMPEPERRRTIVELSQRFEKRPYEKHLAELWLAARDSGLGGMVHLRENLNSLFCSELAAEAFQDLKWIDGGADSLASSEYVPADFSSEGELTLSNAVWTDADEVIVKE